VKEPEPLNADWIDVGLIKIAVFAATLLLAKWYKPVLGPKWYWYMLVCIVAAIRPFTNFFKWLRLVIGE
jgi:uncharacterized membrane protein